MQSTQVAEMLLPIERGHSTCVIIACVHRYVPTPQQLLLQRAAVWKKETLGQGWGGVFETESIHVASCSLELNPSEYWWLEV